jgi:hypothetical protein
MRCTALYNDLAARLPSDGIEGHRTALDVECMQPAGIPVCDRAPAIRIRFGFRLHIAAASPKIDYLGKDIHTEASCPAWFHQTKTEETHGKAYEDSSA